jgi:hypothetical protein
MKITTRSPASKELLLGKVPELAIFKLFCSNFKSVGKRFKSPISLNGKMNTGQDAAIVLPNKRKGFVLYDFRIGRAFSAINFAMLMTGLNFHDTIKYLCGKFNVSEIDPEITIRQMDVEFNENIIRDLAYPCIITVKYDEWSQKSIDYWKQYGWEPFMLDKAKIRPIQKFWVAYEEDKRIEYNKPLIGDLSFTYDFFKVDEVFRRKIYNPLAENKALKWKTNTNKGIIQALNTIEGKVKTLYLVSSMKDCGPFWNVLGHPCAIAPNSESTMLFPDQVRYLKQISERQVVWYDNDETGTQNALKHSKAYGFDVMWNPIGTPKDQSDYVKERGLKEFKKLMIQ